MSPPSNHPPSSSPKPRLGPRGSVKGSVLQSRLAFVQQRKGDGAVLRVLHRLTDEDREILTGMLLPFAWYPFTTNERLDLAIAEEFERGEPIFLQLGEASARDNLTSASQLSYIRERNPHALLKQTSAIFKVYYDTGHRTYERVSDGCAVLRTHDCDSYSVADCLTVVGWHQKAIELCGGRDVRVREMKCRARGDEICEYVCDWTP